MIISSGYVDYIVSVQEIHGEVCARFYAWSVYYTKYTDGDFGKIKSVMEESKFSANVLPRPYVLIFINRLTKKKDVFIGTIPGGEQDRINQIELAYTNNHFLGVTYLRIGTTTLYNI